MKSQEGRGSYSFLSESVDRGLRSSTSRIVEGQRGTPAFPIETVVTTIVSECASLSAAVISHTSTIRQGPTGTASVTTSAVRYGERPSQTGCSKCDRYGGLARRRHAPSALSPAPQPQPTSFRNSDASSVRDWDRLQFSPPAPSSPPPLFPTPPFFPFLPPF